MRVVLLCSLLLLSSCIPHIPEEVLDAGWCRDMAAAKARATGKERENLAAAMIRHHCAAKLAAAHQPAAPSDQGDPGSQRPKS
ncbi:hypothetical protein AB4Z34_31515 [Ensifer sp. 2YAB10]|jgi:hypothetical protein|uniref:hypothetical protein n=1 Tax=unclassified Ensifer TaxID=2633371 RepID=UPI000DE21854|nr:hypothetical protein [Ensifer sp. SSB1]MBK5568683.1 hypothetical protein [Ensifer sp. SSB1]